LQDFAENFRLSRKQEQAIFELVNPSAHSLAEIANKIKVSERTLYNWLKLPHFHERLREERNRLREQPFNNLKPTLNNVVERLGELLDSEIESIKLKACQTILDYNIKIAEVEELEESLTKLEGLNK
jgi:transposase